MYDDKKVYVAGTFQNKPENKEYIEKWCLKLTRLFPEYLFINGVSAFSYYYNDTDMQQGLDMCVELVKTCDSLVTVNDYTNSIGTWVEIYVAKENNMHIYEHIDQKIEELATLFEDEDSCEFGDFDNMTRSYTQMFFGV